MKSKKERRLEALNRLIAEEVLYLNECEWDPIISPPMRKGELASVLWKDPIDKMLFEQAYAVAIQKSRDLSKKDIENKENNEEKT